MKCGGKQQCIQCSIQSEYYSLPHRTVFLTATLPQHYKTDNIYEICGQVRDLGVVLEVLQWVLVQLLAIYNLSRKVALGRKLQILQKKLTYNFNPISKKTYLNASFCHSGVLAKAV